MRHLANITVHIAVALSILAVTVQAQTNYRVTRTMLDASSSRYIDEVEYYDGLGRALQSVNRRAGGDGGDIVSAHYEYDGNGRVTTCWQSVPVSAGGGYTPLADLKSASEQYYGDPFAYTLTDYEPRPTEAVSSVTRPGKDLHNQSRKCVTERIANTATGMLCCAKYTVSIQGVLSHNGQYNAGSFIGEKTTDEDGHIAITFRNSDGKTILSRYVLASGNYADTYYVYDDYNRLRYVLPPMASDALTENGGSWTATDDEVNQYCYYYEYDIAGNAVLRKLPGREAVKTFCDSKYRPILFQDGNQRQNSKYTLAVYDNRCREVITAIVTLSDSERDSLATTSTTASYTGEECDTLGYTLGFSLPYGTQIETVNYYDDYAYLSGSWLSSRTKLVHDSRYGDTPHDTAAGHLTGTIVSGRATAYYYNYHGDAVQTRTENHLGGIDAESFRYSYMRKPLSLHHVHESANDTVTEIYEYVYDHADRLIRETHSLNGAQAVTLQSCSYNRLGQMSGKTVGQEEIAYSYDIEGRSNKITSDAFCQNLRYSDGTSPCYNGNISATEWHTGDGINRAYSFSYDAMNRLVSATYSSSIAGASYDERIAYDKNCNPVSILRTGLTVKSDSVTAFGILDDLSIEYEGNQILSVQENGESPVYVGAADFQTNGESESVYTWDANGNLKTDPDKGITSISYDSRNRPQTMIWGTGHRTVYTYDTSGRKLRAEYLRSNRVINTPVIGLQSIGDGDEDAAETASFEFVTTPLPGIGDSIIEAKPFTTLLTRDYCGSVIYRNDSIERILTSTGYITPDGVYHHYIRDYQGNVRIVATQDGEIIERNNYYPYGMLFPESETAQPFKYSGKEWDAMNGLNLYDFDARWHDPALCLFTTQDPKAEKYYPYSPYLYCAGNPIMLIDPTGMETKEFLNEEKPKDKIISDAAAMYPPNNDIQIFAHGNSNGITVSIDGTEYKIKTAEELIELIKTNFESGEKISKQSNNTIVLHSCKTGSGKNSFAQKVSKSMPNATIIAPDGYVIVGSIDGEMGISKTKNALDKKGEWNVFQAGEIVNTLPHDAKPNGNPGKSIKYILTEWILSIF